jgi:peptide/nickel transport system substrate-binding protein
MGACHPAIEAMIDRLLTSESQDDYVAAVRALDRVLISALRGAVLAQWIGWQPDVWWVEE